MNNFRFPVLEAVLFYSSLPCGKPKAFKKRTNNYATWWIQINSYMLHIPFLMHNKTIYSKDNYRFISEIPPKHLLGVEVENCKRNCISNFSKCISLQALVELFKWRHNSSPDGIGGMLLGWNTLWFHICEFVNHQFGPDMVKLFSFLICVHISDITGLHNDIMVSLKLFYYTFIWYQPIEILIYLMTNPLPSSTPTLHLLPQFSELRDIAFILLTSPLPRVTHASHYLQWSILRYPVSNSPFFSFHLSLWHSVLIRFNTIIMSIHRIILYHVWCTWVNHPWRETGSYSRVCLNITLHYKIRSTDYNALPSNLICCRWTLLQEFNSIYKKCFTELNFNNAILWLSVMC